MRRRRLWHVLMLTALVALALGPSALAQRNDDADDADVVLRVGTILDLANDNPWGVVGGYDWGVATIQYDLLLRFADEDLSASPGLATGCDPSEDRMTWTCHLREGLKWSDGSPLTSEDVAFTYRFVIDNGMSAFRSYFPFNPTF